MFKDKFSSGFVIGLLLPLIGFLLLGILDQVMVTNNTVNKLTGNSHILWSGFKNSTLPLMSICLNLIPVFFANRKRMDEFIRGIMFPTMIFSFTWFFYFSNEFL